MNLTATDKKEIKEIVTDSIVSALDEIVIPRFERLESRMDSLEGRMDAQESATNDLRDEMRAGFATVHKRIDDLDERLSGRISALENDVKEIYRLLAKSNTGSPSEKKFAKLSLEEKILQTHAQLVATAKEAGVTLPS